MLPVGTIGAHYVEHSKMGLTSSFTVVDDGTYWVFSAGGSTIFKVHMTNGNLEIEGDFKARQSL